MTFGSRLKACRECRKITQVEMARVLGVTERHYQAIEQGTTKPRFDGLLILAKHLNTSLDYLMGNQYEKGVQPETYSLSEKKPMVYVGIDDADLREKKEIIKALWENDAIAVGFLGAFRNDADLLVLVNASMRESDYYFALITERSLERIDQMQDEWRYALELNKPLKLFVQKSLSLEKTLFIDESCYHYWTDLQDLGNLVCRSLTQLRRYTSSVGWMSGGSITKEQLARERKLFEEVQNLKIKLKKFTEGQSTRKK